MDPCSYLRKTFDLSTSLRYKDPKIPSEGVEIYTDEDCKMLNRVGSGIFMRVSDIKLPHRLPNLFRGTNCHGRQCIVDLL